MTDRSGRRVVVAATLVVLLAAVAFGLSTAPAAGQSAAPELDCVGNGSGVPYVTDSNLTVYENDTDATIETFYFPDAETVRFAYQSDAVNISAAGDAQLRLESATGTVTCLGDIDATANAVTVSPDGDPDVTLDGSFEAVAFRDANLSAETADLAYTAGDNVTVGLDGLDASKTILARDASDGSVVDSTTSDTGGAATFALPPATDADVTFTTAADSVSVATDPDSNQTAGQSLTAAPAALVTDDGDDPVGGVDVTVTALDGNGSLSGATTVTTGSDGVATFADLSIQTVDDYRLNVSIDDADADVIASDTATTSSFSVGPAATDRVDISPAESQTITQGERIDFSAAAFDAFGNLVEGDDTAFAWDAGTGVITEGGRFEETQPGTYDVTAALDGVTATNVTVTVEQAATPALAGPDIAGEGADATIVEGTDGGVGVIVENVGDVPGSFTLGLSIGGDSVTTSTTSELAAGESEVVTFASVTGGLSPDTYEVSVEDSEGTDSTTGTLTVLREATPDLSGLDVAGEGTNATVVEGTDGDVRVTVENVGDVAGSFTVALQIANGETVSASDTTDRLSPGASETVTFASVTGNRTAGSYDVTVADSEGVDAVTGALTVEEPASFDVAVEETPTAVVAGEMITVSVTVENVGDRSGTQDLVFAVDGDEQDRTNDVELGGDERTREAFTYTTAEDDIGDITASVASADDEATATVTVNEEATLSFSNLDIAGQGVEATITEGEDVEITVDVTNAGDVPGSFTVDLAGESVLVASASTSELAANETETVAFAPGTGDLDTGEYDVTVEAAAGDEGAEATLTVEPETTPDDEGDDGEPADGDTDDAGDADDDGAGFGVAAAALVLFGVAVVASRRRAE